MHYFTGIYESENGVYEGENGVVHVKMESKKGEIPNMTAWSFLEGDVSTTNPNLRKTDIL